jgi:hypothetical protein
LSYSTLDEFNKLLAKLTIGNMEQCADAQGNVSVEFDYILEELIEDMHDIYLGRSDRFKPEIKLSDYSDRPDALDEILQVADVISAERFPWRPESSTNEEIRIPRTAQLRELYHAVKDGPKGVEFKKRLAEKFRDHLRGLGQPGTASP